MSEIWVVVADAERARVFSAETRHGALSELDCLVHTETRAHERDLASDKDGRIAGGQGQGAHDFGDERHFKDLAARTFAREIARYVGEAHGRGAFRRLVMCAAPRFLGLLREAFPDAVRRDVSLEINKDLTHIADPKDIRRHLPDFL